jgi:hypothetical protein
MARLENWRIVVGSLAGRVYGHQYYADGTPIHTSRVVDVLEGQEVRTRNNVYQLGEPDPEFTSFLAKMGRSAQEALTALAVPGSGHHGAESA